MKSGIYVSGLGNEQRFHAGIRTMETRGSAEACWMLVEGEPGYGKSAALERFAFQNKIPFVRAKAEWSANWALRDICQALEIATAARTQAMMETIAARLMERRCPVVIDEINHAARKIDVLETLRDITDQTETVLIAGGMKGCYADFSRYQQIRSRVTEVVAFGPATFDDVRKICNEIADVEIDDSMVELIRRQAAGRLRDIRTAIATVEARMRNARKAVSAEDWGTRALLPMHRSSGLRGIENA